MHDQHVAVVGGSSGVGLALAGLTADQGARVTLLARDAARLATASAASPGSAGLTMDLRRPEAMGEVAAALGQVDHLVICAGVYRPASLTGSGVDQWRELLEERLVGPLALIKALGSAITGSITLFSGTVARRPLPGSIWHSIAAAGMESAVRALSLELAPVRVNALAPGAIDTPMLRALLAPDADAAIARMAERLPVRRIASAEDVARAVLLAMTNPFITGTTIAIDGGAVLV
jgi:NAD(P)-dependent dehydrogenase (short-subunit alcohol dehydrogenase family)